MTNKDQSDKDKPANKREGNALFKINGKEHLKVQFNPQSLKYNISNALKNTKKKVAQHVTKTTAKLSMELIFDTTHSGKDVRTDSNKVAQLLDAKLKKTKTKKGKTKKVNAPPVVTFLWGTYSFIGIVDSFQETIDFFAPNGVPLRSTVSLSLTNHKPDFKPDLNKDFDDKNGSTISAPSNSNTGGGDNAADKDSKGGSGSKGKNGNKRGVQATADKAGASDAAKLLAEYNGIENIRNPEVSFIELSETMLGGTAGPSFGTSVNLSAGINVNAGAIGGKLSAGAGAGAGAFAGLRQVPPSADVSLDLDAFVGGSATVGLDLQGSAAVGLGGQAGFSGGGALVKVGAVGDLKKYLEFDDET